MGDTKIEWTDMTWNPVTGCSKVSTGCKHCYAERLFPRVYGNTYVLDVHRPGNSRKRKFTDIRLQPDRLEQPLHWKKPRMIFVNSMSDLFHEDVPFEFIDKIFAIMALSSEHTFQILTKRPKRMFEYSNQLISGKRKIGDALAEMNIDSFINRMAVANAFGVKMGVGDDPGHPPYKPFPNVWLGISCENQTTADERIPILLQVPAAVRFLSCEPLLEKINLKDALMGYPSWPRYKIYFVDWVIVGGESGPGYRPMKPEWAKSIIEQCQAAKVPVFMKQMAGKKEIPEYLKIREFPNGRNK